MVGLRTTIYKVGDIEAAKKWYTTVFETAPYFDEPYYIGFNIKGYELGLQPETTSTKPKIDTVLSYWGVENIHESYNRILAAGASIHEASTNVGGELMVASVKDPWNNIIGLIYNLHFKLS